MRLCRRFLYCDYGNLYSIDICSFSDNLLLAKVFYLEILFLGILKIDFY